MEGALSDGDYDHGVAALANGDIDDAEGAFKRIHDRDPKDAVGLVLLGLIREKQGNKEVAEKAYRRAIELRSDLEAAYVTLSGLLVEERRPDDALAVAREGLTRAHSSAALHANAATALADKGERTCSATEFDLAVRAALTTRCSSLRTDTGSASGTRRAGALLSRASALRRRRLGERGI